MKSKLMRVISLFAVLTVVLTACAPAATPTASPVAPPTTAPATQPPPAQMTKVTLQLQWFAQSQFAGYFAALDKGYYTAEGLDVTIKEGAVDIVPQQVLASGQAEFALAWVPKALVSREQGANITDIGQVFQRSGTLEISWKDSNITQPSDWKGKKVGTWGFGNEFELLAAMSKAGLDSQKDLTIVQQPFDMNFFITRQADAAEAMTYNEYAQVLEQKDPKTGNLYQPSDLNVIDFNKVGTAMLQDAVWARQDWLQDPKNKDTALRFLRASFKGWVFCRDNFDECVNIVLKHGTQLGKAHMAWMLNEINKLIWPSPAGIGVMDKALWDQTVQIATSQKVIKAAPDANAYTNDLAAQAVKDLTAQGVDVMGANYKPQTVTITPGGN
jgi:NitT/TauT family transport system substrate-binding protein